MPASGGHSVPAERYAGISVSWILKQVESRTNIVVCVCACACACACACVHVCACVCFMHVYHSHTVQ